MQDIYYIIRAQFLPFSHLPQRSPWTSQQSVLIKNHYNPHFQPYEGSNLEPHHQQCHSMRRAHILKMTNLQIELRSRCLTIPQRPQMLASAQLSKASSFSLFIPHARHEIDKSGFSPSSLSSDAVFSTKRWSQREISSLNPAIPGIATAAIP